MIDMMSLEKIWLWKDFIDFMSSFLVTIEDNRIRIIIIYVFILISMIIRLYYSKKTFQQINNLFRVSIDGLYYDISLILYKSKDSIYEFHKNIPLLLNNKTITIAKRERAYYYEDYDKLIEEIEYIYTLTWSDKIIIDKETIDIQHKLLLKLNHTIHSLQNTITMLTLGVSKIIY
jgi:hypothetical protein